MIAPPPRSFMCGTASRDARMAGNSVSSNRRLPLGVGGVEQIRAGRPADVVDEDVEPAERVDRPVHDERDSLRRRHVGLHRHDHVRTPRRRLDLERRVRQLLGSARADAHPAPFGHERPRAREPKPAARAGDDGDLVGERQVQFSSVPGRPPPLATDR